jgi:hypothetical protein
LLHSVVLNGGLSLENAGKYLVIQNNHFVNTLE